MAKGAKVVLIILSVLAIVSTAAVLWFVVIIGDSSPRSLEPPSPLLNEYWWSHTDGALAIISPRSNVAVDAVHFLFSGGSYVKYRNSDRSGSIGTSRIVIDEGTYTRSGNTLTTVSELTSASITYDIAISTDYIRGSSKMTLTGGGTEEFYENTLEDDSRIYLLWRALFVLSWMAVIGWSAAIYNEYLGEKYDYYPTGMLSGFLMFVAIMYNIIGQGNLLPNMNMGFLAFPDFSETFLYSERWQVIFIIKTMIVVLPFILLLMLKAYLQTKSIKHTLINTFVQALKKVLLCWLVAPFLADLVVSIGFDPYSTILLLTIGVVLYQLIKFIFKYRPPICKECGYEMDKKNVKWKYNHLTEVTTNVDEFRCPNCGGGFTKTTRWTYI